MGGGVCGCCGHALRCHEGGAVGCGVVGVHALQLDGVAGAGCLAAEGDLRSTARARHGFVGSCKAVTLGTQHGQPGTDY